MIQRFEIGREGDGVLDYVDSKAEAILYIERLHDEKGITVFDRLARYGMVELFTWDGRYLIGCQRREQAVRHE